MSHTMKKSLPHIKSKWRRGGDSNPRWSCPHTTFPRLHHRPLGHLSSLKSLARTLVPEEGLEPSRTHVRQILSLLRLPLRHSGIGAGEGNRTLVASLEGWSSAIELRPPLRMNFKKYTIFSPPKARTNLLRIFQRRQPDGFRRRCPSRYFRVTFTTSGESSTSATRFGNAIRPLTISAMPQTADIVRYGPMNTIAT